MSVDITFQPLGLNGLVAEGTYVLAAAKRMGVRVAADCKGPVCTQCIVSILTGQSLLSAPTEHERKTLGQEDLAQGRRLACQTRVERSGELAVRVILSETPSELKPDKDVRKKFGELPLNQKLTTLVQLEVTTVSEALDVIVERSVSAGEKLMDFFARRGRRLGERERAGKPPLEHRQREKG